MIIKVLFYLYVIKLIDLSMCPLARVPEQDKIDVFNIDEQSKPQDHTLDKYSFESSYGHAEKGLNGMRDKYDYLVIKKRLTREEADALIARADEALLLLRSLKRFKNNTQPGEANRAIILFHSLPSEKQEYLLGSYEEMLQKLEILDENGKPL
jgi:hypothetical protein